jgi:hypothetical protein
MSKIHKTISLDPKVLKIFEKKGLKNFSSVVNNYFLSLEDKKSFLVSRIDILNNEIESLKYDIERLEVERVFNIKKLKKLNGKEDKNDKQQGNV